MGLKFNRGYQKKAMKKLAVSADLMRCLLLIQTDIGKLLNSRPVGKILRQ
jgi:hypothetical protein